ncbi:zinc-dependent metalloprotease [Bacillus sp. SCS-153A]|uniref:zinc-dependent metalloprotease n=1 Tax=Rossellomorea sedimentorum TaxID=3115294 RepID=UPI0039065E65
MKKNKFITLSLALSLAVFPSLPSASSEATVDLQDNSAHVGHSLPKAEFKGKQEFDSPSFVEQSSVAEVLDEKGQKKKDKRIEKSKEKKKDKEKKDDKETSELFGLFGDGGGSDSGSGDTSTTADRTVTVLVAVDEEYRAANPDWQTLTQNIVEKADDAFMRDHGIDFQIQAFAEWSSQGNDAVEILQDLERDWDGRGYDFVAGFTKDANFNSGGIAYVYSSSPSGSAISVNLDQGAQNTAYAAQHEFSHNYGLGHAPQGSGIKCIMNYDYAYQVDYWHQEHDDEIQAHKTWYGN